MKLVIATRNKDKYREINDILSDLSAEIVSLEEFSDIPEIVEDGKTLEENAIKKAKTVSHLTKTLSLAEDTGLEVDYLNGKPGVFSARFAGPGCSYSDNNLKLLAELEGVPKEKRTAQFRCVAAVAEPDGKVVTVEGRVKGYIAAELHGSSGFGYDPLFILPEYGRTFAEIDLKEKNKISHRARAINEAKKILLEILKQT